MCGIAGFSNRLDLENLVDRQTLISMTQALQHRGPDDEGYFWSSEVGLGSRRLSIIDLSPLGRMPIWNEDRTIAIVQNGEIYNFKSIRERLLKNGHRFAGNSDTEVIVHLYEEMGEKCFSELDGMFAIAIWDGLEKKLLLARDRFGEKPLYYYFNSGRLIFASELKSLVLAPGFSKSIKWKALGEFLTLGFISAPDTPYQNVWKLQPGHYLSFSQQSGNVVNQKYWQTPDFSKEASPRREAEYLEEFQNLFFESVESRMVSDVPVGAFLSGGIDSSLIVAAMSRLQGERVQTFSIGYQFSSKYNENDAAEKVASVLGVRHTTLSVQFKDVLGMIEKLPWLWDEPIGDPALLGAYLITKKAREDGFTVMLSGDGGDELFLGYPLYRWLKKLDYFYQLPHVFRKGIAASVSTAGHILKDSRLEKGAHSLTYPDVGSSAYYLTGYGAWPVEQIEKLMPSGAFNLKETIFSRAFDGEFYNPQSMYRGANAIAATFLPDSNQARMDRVSMANSVETRAPFLNPRIAEFAASLPINMKIRGSVSKYILRKSLSGFLPQEIWNRPKHGFNALPMAEWLRSDLNFLVKDYLDPSRLRQQGIFDEKMMTVIVDQHMKGGVYNNWWKIWLMVVLQVWLERWYD